MRDVPPGTSNAWKAFFAVLLGALAWAAKRPWAFGRPLARVPVRHRAKVVLALGALAGIIATIARGTPLADAVVHGLFSAGAAIVVHGALGGVNPQASSARPTGDTPIVAAAPPDPTPPVGVARVAEDGPQLRRLSARPRGGGIKRAVNVVIVLASYVSSLHRRLAGSAG